MRGFIAFGKQVKDSAGEHFADAATDVGARLIVAALNFRHHHPEIEGDIVRCKRCQGELPDDGDEPCVAKTPRCTETPDMFDAETTENLHPLRPADDGGAKQRTAVRKASKRSPAAAQAASADALIRG